MSEQSLINHIRISRTENIGPKTFHALMLLHGSVDRIIDALPDMSLRGGRKKPLKIASKSDAIKEIEACAKKNAHMIAINDKDYPELLKHIKDAPPVLTIYGNRSVLNNRSIAIVGARNSSANGCNFAEKLARDLSQNGIFVTSGLARGIDTAAHRGSLEGGTIAVVAGGIDKIYPPENKDLFKQIGEKGAVVAEMPFGAVPKAQNFPRRNRIISGMSIGTAIIEASLNSGSLITARMALEQDREIFAVPGSPLDPRCKGTNRLIKDGAHLLESADDIISQLDMLQSSLTNHMADNNNEFKGASINHINESEVDRHRNYIIEKLGASPTSVDEIIDQTGLPTNIVLTVLLELELAGRLNRHAGNKVSLNFINEELFEETAF